MNPEQLLDFVAGQIKATAEKTTGKVHIVRQGNEIKVIASGVRTTPAIPIASYTAEKAREGLTIDEWTSLGRRLAKTMKEIEKCNEPSKP